MFSVFNPCAKYCAFLAVFVVCPLSLMEVRGVIELSWHCERMRFFFFIAFVHEFFFFPLLFVFSSFCRREDLFFSLFLLCVFKTPAIAYGD